LIKYSAALRFGRHYERCFSNDNSSNLYERLRAQSPRAVGRSGPSPVRACSRPQKTRERLITETWPRSVTVRNSTFLRAALHTNWATKYNLTVQISNVGGSVPPWRGHLAEHAEGGTKTPFGHSNLAIPLKSWVRYGAHGINKSMLPANIVRTTPKRALRITKDGIYVGQGGQLHLRYSLKPSATIKPDVPFQQDFNTFMLEEIKRAFPERLAQAMATRR
jgi:hypothetical protein